MKKLFTLIVIVAFTFGLKAATVPVATYTELKNAATTNANDGDIIELTDASTIYDAGAGASFSIAKKITIRAAAGLANKPTIAKVTFALTTGGALHIEGIKAYYDVPGSTTFTDSKYFITLVTATATHDYVRVVNCDISGYGRSLVRADNTSNIATITELLIDNCTVTNVSAVNAGYSTIAVKTALITNATIKNSTFYSCKSGIFYSEQASTPINFLMENVTIYNCGTGTGSPLAKEIVCFKKPNPSLAVAIKNTMMWGSYEPAGMADSVITVATTALDVKLLNSVVNVPTLPSVVTPIAATWTENTAITSITNFSLDANLKITANQALKDLYDAGTVVGDPRGYPMTVNNISKVNYTVLKNTITVTNNTIVLDKTSDVEIYTVTGKSIKSLKSVDEVSISSLPKGIYLVKATVNGQSVAQKFVVR